MKVPGVMAMMKEYGMRGVVLCGLVLLCGTGLAQSPVSYVDPFIGTANGGNTFPGAVRPWGMVSVSPHTVPGSPSGYIFGSPDFYGLGHVHLSGTGCSDLGSIILTVTRDSAAIVPEMYKTSYADERAEAGYYRVTLTDAGVLVEAAAAVRSGITRFTALRDGMITLLLDAGRNLSIEGGGAVRILSSTTAEGFNIAGGFCGEANRQQVYFAARIDRSASGMGCWKGSRINAGSAADTVAGSVGMWARYYLKKGEQILVRVGISYVGTSNAWNNLNAEVSAKSFEEIRTEARDAWDRELGRIGVSGGPDANKTKFYTALYHSLIHPNIISDVNGDYPVMGHTGIGNNKERERYSVFSLWDTYRTLHPLLTLVYPERQSAIIATMLDMYRESGWLPKWELISNETCMMVGDPAGVVIADSYAKGIRDFDAGLAFEAMCKPSDWTTADTAPPVRAGYHEYLRYGYIPADQDMSKAWWVWGPVSTTLEYCVADWCIAQMALALGRNAEADEYLRRSQFYKSLFDPETRLLRPKMRSGAWLSPFDQFATEGSGDWGGSGGPGYVEGNAWHYTWFVPHDVKGLAQLFGGVGACAAKLDSAFANGQFTVNNEPDIGYPYLYTQLAGQETKTAPILFKLMNEQFGTGPRGLPGNDDAGTISAWFVLSALGFYPAVPGTDTYEVGIPLFEHAEIALRSPYHAGTRCIIDRFGSVEPVPRLESIRINGNQFPGYQLKHGELTAGGRIEFSFTLGHR